VAEEVFCYQSALLLPILKYVSDKGQNPLKKKKESLTLVIYLFPATGATRVSTCVVCSLNKTPVCSFNSALYAGSSSASAEAQNLKA